MSCLATERSSLPAFLRGNPRWLCKSQGRGDFKALSDQFFFQPGRSHRFALDDQDACFAHVFTKTFRRRLPARYEIAKVKRIGQSSPNILAQISSIQNRTLQPGQTRAAAVRFPPSKGMTISAASKHREETHIRTLPTVSMLHFDHRRRKGHPTHA